MHFDFSAYKGKMDFVFIDGDHHYESVLKDSATAFELLKDDHSIIAWHDYTNGPETIRWEVFHGILTGCDVLLLVAWLAAWGSAALRHPMARRGSGFSPEKAGVRPPRTHCFSTAGRR